MRPLNRMTRLRHRGALLRVAALLAAGSGNPRAQDSADPLNLPGLALPIAAGKVESLEDDIYTRRYVYSSYAGLSRHCGEPPQSLAMAAAGYLDPMMAPGRDIAELGMRQFLMWGKALRSGDIRDLADASGASRVVEEAVADGTSIAGRWNAAPPSSGACRSRWSGCFAPSPARIPPTSPICSSTRAA